MFCFIQDLLDTDIKGPSRVITSYRQQIREWKLRTKKITGLLLTIFYITISRPSFLDSPLPQNIVSCPKTNKDQAVGFLYVKILSMFFNSTFVSFFGWGKCGWRSCVPTVGWYMLQEHPPPHTILFLYRMKPQLPIVLMPWQHRD